ncbi:MAG TPA: hypothetical protein VN622_06645 [Clostridia bacterium]|nr:hypothetical protein [Clostridia bacterium]
MQKLLLSVLIGIGVTFTLGYAAQVISLPDMLETLTIPGAWVVRNALPEAIRRSVNATEYIFAANAIFYALLGYIVLTVFEAPR